MPTGDLVPSSDGRLAMTVGPWAKEKLFYVRGYCDIFNTGMKGKWRTRTYVDLFSGPGKCIVETTGEEVDGSPLIALQCEAPFTHYFFNDLSADAIEALESGAASFTWANITYFNMDCNDVVNYLLPQLPPSSLDFCFVDPYNWQIKFPSIQRLTKARRMDLVITFQTGAIRRVADNPPQELDDFFGDAGWRTEYKAQLLAGRHTRGRILLDIYEQRLRGLGYIQIQDYLPVKNTRSAVLYHLIYASKDPRGKDFWDKISRRSSTGQLRLRL